MKPPSATSRDALGARKSVDEQVIRMARGRRSSRRFAAAVPLRIGLPVCLFALLVAGCGGTPDRSRQADGHPVSIPVDLASIPDAVPRDEPLSRYGNPPEYEVFGQRYRTLVSSEGFEQRGIASWYGTRFHGRRTSSGEPYDMFAMTAAHRQLPLPSYVEVVNLENGKRVVVRVNDRGPFVGGRVIDLSYAAAHRIGMLERGVAPVLVRALGRDDIGSATLQSADANTVDGPNHPVSSGEANGNSRFIQIGAFGSHDAAKRVQQDLNDLGFSGVTITMMASDGGARLHRVRIGPLEHPSTVREVEMRLQRAAVDDYRLVTE